MRVKMTIVKDVVKSTGRQITVEITSEERITAGKIKQIGDPLQITHTFGKNVTGNDILRTMKNTVKTMLRNWRKQNDSFVKTFMEFDI